MSAPASPLESFQLIDPAYYGSHGYPHEQWAQLRRHAPIEWMEPPGFVPFWAVTKYEDLVSISKQPQVFLSEPRLAVLGNDLRDSDQPLTLRFLLNMDPPEHGEYRKLVSKRFTPRSIERMKQSVELIATEILDSAMGDGGPREGDFVEMVSSRFPLAVLADLLGVPREDWELMFRWTAQATGSRDPEYQQGLAADKVLESARVSLFQYFSELAEKRRKDPRDDIVSVLATATVDASPLPVIELLSYYFLLVVAGNETTRNATSGGVLALMENPQQLELIRRNPSLLETAVEEILRWTSPVIHFCRTAARDVEIRGQRIRAGDSLCLFYPSANRDEDVFEDAMCFRVDRAHNPHVAFGIGEHVCLGAHMARLELRTMLGQLLRRLVSLEAAGPVERLHSSLVGGIKRMPLRFELRPV